ncbi:MAG: HNH endonuclease [Rhodospirillales bacterium]|nr:MAG: HNH endonuclease [Rhodospirillales bacterium]
MDYLNITLGIALHSGNTHSSAGQGPLTADLRQKILKRDSYTCRFCGFTSQKYQDIHFLDGNPSNIRLENLATACIFCHQCFDLERTAEMRSGALIWLPEIEQAQLHHIARAIYVARISQGSMAESAKNAYKILMERREEAKNRLGTDDPFILGTVMRDFTGPRQYSMRAKKLEGVRLFPLDRRIIKEGDLEFNQFPQILAYWRSKDGPFGGKAPYQWKKFYAKFKQAA